MPKAKKTTGETKSMMGGRVMERIHAEHITPIKPYVFWFQKIFLGITVGISLLLGIYFTSVSLFKLSTIHVFGRSFILSHLPWFSMGIALSCFLVTFALLEYYKVFYKVSLIALFTSLVVVFFMLGFLFTKTSVHTHLMQSKVSGLYSVEEKPLQVYAGRALEVRTQNAFVLETLRGERIHMYIPSETKLPEAGIQPGQSLFVTGYYQSGTFIVKGILSLGRTQG